jgi:acetylornithine deacetylase/succinyl-diaminopimelate desuccinylase-like protein
MVPVLLSNSVTTITILAMILALACGGARPPRAPRAAPGPQLGAEAAALLSEAVRIRTVSPPGDERPLAELLVAELRAAGLEAEVIETPRGDSRTGRAAAWGVLRGRGGGAPIVLLSHLDVVPAEPAGWSVDPFAGVVANEHVMGRGALDAKGVAIVHLFTLTELARRGPRLSRDVIFLATPDEEMGGLHGAGYVVRQRRDLLGGARYLLTEGGGIAAGDERGSVWGIGVTEKAPCWLRVTARGTPGHGSVPARDAAISLLIEGLSRVDRLETPVRVVPEVAAMFRALSVRAPEGDDRAYRDLAAALDSDPDFRARFLAQRASAALVRNTVAITVLEGGSATNVIPAVASAHLDARLLPGETCESFLAQIERTLADPGLGVERLLAFRANASPIDTPLYRAIARVAEATDPHALVVPRMNAGFNDAHYFRELGITAYGFVPRWLRPEDARGIHGTDERVSIENLERGIAAMIQILEALEDEE